MTTLHAKVTGTPLGRPGPGLRLRRWRLTRGSMVSMVIRRVFTAVPLLLLVSSLSFVLLSLTPGDAARQILGTRGTPEQYEALRQQLGLDQPVYEQFWHWLSRAVTGDFGTSIINGTSVAGEIWARLPVTLSLISGAILVSVVVGVAGGVFSAVKDGWLARAIDALVLVVWALPVFWVGSMLVVVFAIKLEWLPAVGYVPLSESPTAWARSLALPVFALSLGSVAAVVKQTREAMLDVLGSDYIRMAAANGIPPRSLIFRHALKNAAIPVVTVVGLQTIGLFGGAVLIENLFAVPGLGSLLVTSALSNDIPAVQAVAVVFTLVVIIVNFAVDIAYGLLNPKLRSS